MIELKENIVACPKCGALFDLTIKGESKSLWNGSGVFCPVCDTLAVPKEDHSEGQEDEKEKDQESWL
jgi:uncharacterized Zn finger protein (UPF0148 family)